MESECINNGNEGSTTLIRVIAAIILPHSSCCVMTTKECASFLGKCNIYLPFKTKVSVCCFGSFTAHLIGDPLLEPLQPNHPTN